VFDFSTLSNPAGGNCEQHAHATMGPVRPGW
jgi:hypothetical protein